MPNQVNVDGGALTRATLQSNAERALALLVKAFEMAEAVKERGDGIEEFHHDFLVRRVRHVINLCEDAIRLIADGRAVSPIVLTRAALETRALIAATHKDAHLALEVIIQETEACGIKLNKHLGNEEVGSDYFKMAAQLREQFKLTPRSHMRISHIFEQAEMTDEYRAEYHLGSLYAHGSTVAVASQDSDSWRLPTLLQLVQTLCHVTGLLTSCINFEGAAQINAEACELYGDLKLKPRGSAPAPDTSVVEKA